MADIELKNVSKIFDQNRVVDNVSLTVSDGEFLALVGPSGCGKSTILRMISGLESIDEGTVTIDGEVVNEISPKNRDIAMVFQNYALYPHMSVYDNLAFGLKMKKVPKDEIEQVVQSTAELLSITEFLNRKPKQLSGGQKQRIALGRAIVRNPKAFLFDEPLSNLDAKLRVKMRTDLLKLHRSQNATSVYVTHDQVEAMTMAERIAIINEGVIQQVDTPLRVYNNPANRFVAGFIGSPAMNFLPGSISRENGTPKFQSDSSRVHFELPNGLMDKLSADNLSEVTLGIRPEDITLTPSEKTVPFQSIDIDLIEHMGDISLLHITMEPGNEWTVKIPPNEILQAEQNVQLHFDRDAIHLFDGKTEKNLLKN